MSRRTPIVLLALLAGPAVLLASAGAGGPQRSAQPDALSALVRRAGGPIETRHLTLTLSSTPASAAPDSRVTLLVDVVPKPAMHVYAPEQQDVIPIALVLKPNDSFRAGARRLPPSEAYFFAPLKETQRVYSRPFRIEQDIRVAGTPAVRRRAAAGGTSLTIDGHVRYQACDDAICYLPQDVPVSWTIPLKPS